LNHDIHTPERDGKMDELIYLEPRSTFDTMILGVAEGTPKLVYDLDAMISHWVKEFQDKETSEEEAHTMAIEWFEFNVLGAYWGEHTPVYVSKSALDHIEDCL
jgi:hypothetical protein